LRHLQQIEPQMRCLLVTATPKEIAPFMEYFHQTEKTLHLDFELHVLETGIGSISTAYALTKALQHEPYDLVIQAGIAGCYDRSMPLASVVAIKSDTAADVGVQEKNGFQSIFDFGLGSPNRFPFQRGLLKNPHTEWLKRTKLKAVTAVTVQEITTAPKRIKHYETSWKPKAESMEGAAFHFVCLQEGVPFLQIRSFSNYVGVRNKREWKMEEAISALNNVLIRLMESL